MPRALVIDSGQRFGQLTAVRFFWKGQRRLSQYVALQMRLRERDSSSG
jgi:hypothetical protein